MIQNALDVERIVSVHPKGFASKPIQTRYVARSDTSKVSVEGFEIGPANLQRSIVDLPGMHIFAEKAVECGWRACIRFVDVRASRLRACRHTYKDGCCGDPGQTIT